MGHGLTVKDYAFASVRVDRWHNQSTHGMEYWMQSEMLRTAYRGSSSVQTEN
jgi:hypothetical protein